MQSVTDADTNGNPNERSVLGRAARVMDAFGAQDPVLSLNDLTARVGLPKSTVHRIAEQLVELSWLERTACGYRVGMRLFEIGGLVESRHRLRNAALPYLQDLSQRFRMSAHLGVLDGHEVLYLETLPARGAALPTRQGSRMPAYCTGLGKALLAFSDQKCVDATISHGLAPRTEYTIVVPDVLRNELGEIVRNGVAYDREESIRGVGCAAAPLRGSGRAIGAISLTGSSSQANRREVTMAGRDAAKRTWAYLFG
ncbi:MAG: IclR family transcriptional regulator [Actinobacteria bacterium]|nr:IclR family transcriptional regulator [Actinomycetota bacterium]